MNNAIQRIFQEQSLIHDKMLHIVRDAEPVCPQHYLILPRRRCSSLASLPAETVLHLQILLQKFFTSGQYALIERGNASFCTSFDAPSYAHAHLVNLQFFTKDVLSFMVSEQNYRTAQSVSDALSMVGEGQEYLLVGKANSQQWFLVCPFDTEIKRYSRQKLLEQLTHEDIY